MTENPFKDFSSKRDTLWDNAMVRDAKAKMSKEDLEQYKKIGEQFYRDMDFQQNNDLNAILKESVAYISMGLNSGLLPSELNKDEKRVMKELMGEKWYEKWGYTEKDLLKKKNREINANNKN